LPSQRSHVTSPLPLPAHVGQGTDFAPVQRRHAPGAAPPSPRTSAVPKTKRIARSVWMVRPPVDEVRGRPPRSRAVTPDGNVGPPTKPSEESSLARLA